MGRRASSRSRGARRCCCRARSSSSAASAADVDFDGIVDAMTREGWRWGRLVQLQCALSAFPDTADLDAGNDEFLAAQARIPDGHPDAAMLRLWCLTGMQFNQSANAARALLAMLTARKEAMAADINLSLQQPPSKPPMQTPPASEATAAAAGAGAKPAANNCGIVVVGNVTTMNVTKVTGMLPESASEAAPHAADSGAAAEDAWRHGLGETAEDTWHPWYRPRETPPPSTARLLLHSIPLMASGSKAPRGGPPRAQGAPKGKGAPKGMRPRARATPRATRTAAHAPWTWTTRALSTGASTRATWMRAWASWPMKETSRTGIECRAE